MRLMLLSCLLILLIGCGETNPLEEMVKPENIKTTWIAMGEAYLDACDKQQKSFNAGKCSQEIEQAVRLAFNRGYKELKISHFNDEMIARYLNNLKANGVAMAKKIATSKTNWEAD